MIGTDEMQFGYLSCSHDILHKIIKIINTQVNLFTIELKKDETICNEVWHEIDKWTWQIALYVVLIFNWIAKHFLLNHCGIY